MVTIKKLFRFLESYLSTNIIYHHCKLFCFNFSNNISISSTSFPRILAPYSIVLTGQFML